MVSSYRTAVQKTHADAGLSPSSAVQRTDLQGPRLAVRGVSRCATRGCFSDQHPPPLPVDIEARCVYITPRGRWSRSNPGTVWFPCQTVHTGNGIKPDHHEPSSGPLQLIFSDGIGNAPRRKKERSLSWLASTPSKRSVRNADKGST